MVPKNKNNKIYWNRVKKQHFLSFIIQTVNDTVVIFSVFRRVIFTLFGNSHNFDTYTLVPGAWWRTLYLVLAPLVTPSSLSEGGEWRGNAEYNDDLDKECASLLLCPPLSHERTRRLPASRFKFTFQVPHCCRKKLTCWSWILYSMGVGWYTRRYVATQVHIGSLGADTSTKLIVSWQI